MGSGYFYLEFLMAWLSMLKDKGYRNPVIFALEYTLVPDQTWPQQFEETALGYNLLCDYLGDSSKICLSGDSAGATLMLSCLLHRSGVAERSVTYGSDNKPGLALLLSPWTHLVSDLNQNTPSDYLNADSLHLYGRQYAGHASVEDTIISPGLTKRGWKEVSPVKGFVILYGAEEVFAPGIEETIRRMRKDGAHVKVKKVGSIPQRPTVEIVPSNFPSHSLTSNRKTLAYMPGLWSTSSLAQLERSDLVA